MKKKRKRERGKGARVEWGGPTHPPVLGLAAVRRVLASRLVA